MNKKTVRDIDLKNKAIHIHAQQVVVTEDGHVRYEYDPHTKNEKGVSQDGRYFPVYKELQALLSEIKAKQKKYGVPAKYVFCLRNGNPITIHGYTKFLRRICKHVGLDVTNNHGFRMGINSNVLIPAGFTAAERASLLGHSIETNLHYYSFVQKDHLKRAKNVLNQNEKSKKEPQGCKFRLTGVSIPLPAA